MPSKPQHLSDVPAFSVHSSDGEERDISSSNSSNSSNGSNSHSDVEGGKRNRNLDKVFALLNHAFLTEREKWCDDNGNKVGVFARFFGQANSHQVKYRSKSSWEWDNIPRGVKRSVSLPDVSGTSLELEQPHCKEGLLSEIDNHTTGTTTTTSGIPTVEDPRIRNDEPTHETDEKGTTQTLHNRLDLDIRQSNTDQESDLPSANRESEISHSYTEQESGIPRATRDLSSLQQPYHADVSATSSEEEKNFRRKELDSFNSPPRNHSPRDRIRQYRHSIDLLDSASSGFLSDSGSRRHFASRRHTRVRGRDFNSAEDGFGNGIPGANDGCRDVFSSSEDGRAQGLSSASDGRRNGISGSRDSCAQGFSGAAAGNGGRGSGRRSKDSCASAYSSASAFRGQSLSSSGEGRWEGFKRPEDGRGKSLSSVDDILRKAPLSHFTPDKKHAELSAHQNLAWSSSDRQTLRGKADRPTCKAPINVDNHRNPKRISISTESERDDCFIHRRDRFANHGNDAVFERERRGRRRGDALECMADTKYNQIQAFLRDVEEKVSRRCHGKGYGRNTAHSEQEHVQLQGGQWESDRWGIRHTENQDSRGRTPHRPDSTLSSHSSRNRSPPSVKSVTSSSNGHPPPKPRHRSTSRSKSSGSAENSNHSCDNDNPAVPECTCALFEDNVETRESSHSRRLQGKSLQSPRRSDECPDDKGSTTTTNRNHRTHQDLSKRVRQHPAPQQHDGCSTRSKLPDVPLHQSHSVASVQLEREATGRQNPSSNPIKTSPPDGSTDRFQQEEKRNTSRRHNRLSYTHSKTRVHPVHPVRRSEPFTPTRSERNTATRHRDTPAKSGSNRTNHHQDTPVPKSRVDKMLNIPQKINRFDAGEPGIHRMPEAARRPKKYDNFDMQLLSESLLEPEQNDTAKEHSLSTDQSSFDFAPDSSKHEEKQSNHSCQRTNSASLSDRNADEFQGHQQHKQRDNLQDRDNELHTVHETPETSALQLQNPDHQIHSDDEKVQSHQASIDEKAQSHQASIDEKVQSHQASIDEKAQSHQASIDEKAQSHQASIDEKAQSHHASIDKKAQSHQANIDDIDQCHQASIDEKAQSHQASIDEKAQSHQTSIDEKAQSHQANIDEKAQSHQASIDESTQSHQASIDEKAQSHQASIDEKAQSHQASIDEKVHSHQANIEDIDQCHVQFCQNDTAEEQQQQQHPTDAVQSPTMIQQQNPQPVLVDPNTLHLSQDIQQSHPVSDQQAGMSCLIEDPSQEAQGFIPGGDSKELLQVSDPIYSGFNMQQQTTGVDIGPEMNGLNQNTCFVNAYNQQQAEYVPSYNTGMVPSSVETVTADQHTWQCPFFQMQQLLTGNNGPIHEQPMLSSGLPPFFHPMSTPFFTPVNTPCFQTLGTPYLQQGTPQFSPANFFQFPPPQHLLPFDLHSRMQALPYMLQSPCVASPAPTPQQLGMTDNGLHGQGIDNGLHGQGIDNGLHGQGIDNGLHGQGIDNGLHGQGIDNGLHGQGYGYQPPTPLDTPCGFAGNMPMVKFPRVPSTGVLPGNDAFYQPQAGLGEY